LMFEVDEDVAAAVDEPPHAGRDLSPGLFGVIALAQPEVSEVRRKDLWDHQPFGFCKAQRHIEFPQPLIYRIRQPGFVTTLEGKAHIARQKRQIVIETGNIALE